MGHQKVSIFEKQFHEDDLHSFFKYLSTPTNLCITTIGFDIFFVYTGKTRARKSGGELHTLSRKGIGGRIRKPRRGRARAARLDAEIRKKQADNTSLAKELDIAKQELEETRAEVARLESAEKGDSAATTIQSAARARKARIEVERRKLAIIQRQQEIAQREAELLKKQEGK